MSATRRLAISYSRFSDLKQAKGDSEDRQGRLFRSFCERHNLTPLAEVFADRGRSGYKDEHRTKGRLGQLVAMAKDGRFEPGTVIVVEAWDRLGRLRPDRMTELVAELVRLGIAIGVCRLDDIFTEDDFGTHKWTTLAVFIQLAFQESKQKADRVAASWVTRREAVRKGAGAVNHDRGGCLRLGQLPAWLESVDGTVRIIPERAAALKRIYKLAASGYGQARIVNTLTTEGVPPVGEVRGTEGRTRSQFSGRWSRSYVSLLLRDRRVVGELQPCKTGDVQDGPPIPGYYPAVVTEKQFLLARAGQSQRRWDEDKLGRRIVDKESRYVNTFRGLLRHARDGEGMHLHNKGNRANPLLLLVNARGQEGRDETCYTFPYLLFERAVLAELKEVDAAAVFPQVEQTDNRVDELRADLERVRQDRGAIKADLDANGYSKELAAMLRDREVTEEKIATALQEELARSVRPAGQALAQVQKLTDAIDKDGNDARLKIRAALLGCVESIGLLVVRRRSLAACVVQIWFTGGHASREYVIFYQPAAKGRPGIGVEDKPWATLRETVPDAAGVDLRNKDHVAKFAGPAERVLETMHTEQRDAKAVRRRERYRQSKALGQRPAPK